MKKKPAKPFKPLEENEALKLLGKRIKAARKTAGKSQMDLAFEKDINLRRLSAWETGSDVKLTSIVRLCNALEITLSEFFSDGFD